MPIFSRGQILSKFFPLALAFRFQASPTLDFFADFHWDMSRKCIDICNLCYNAAVLKKIVKIALLGPYLKGKKRVSIGHTQNQV